MLLREVGEVDDIGEVGLIEREREDASVSSPSRFERLADPRTDADSPRKTFFEIFF